MAVDAYLKEASALLQRAAQQLKDEADSLRHDADSQKRSMLDTASKLENDARAKEAEQSVVDNDAVRATLVVAAQAERRDANDKKADVKQLEDNLRRAIDDKLRASDDLLRYANDLSNQSGNPAFR